MKEFAYLKAHTGKRTKATCAGPLTFGSRIHPGKLYKGVVEVAERFAEVINEELQAAWWRRAPTSSSSTSPRAATYPGKRWRACTTWPPRA